VIDPFFVLSFPREVARPPPVVDVRS